MKKAAVKLLAFLCLALILTSVFSIGASASDGAAPAITVQPKAATVAAGASATFKVTAEGTGLSYQWQYSTDNGSTWKTWSGKTSASVSVKAGETNNGTCYRVTVKNAEGSVNSSSAKLTVSGVKPAIKVQPKATTAAAGTSTAFKVTAAGTGLSYQWQYSKDNGATWKTWSGKTSASVSVKAGETNNGTCYRVTVKNAEGSVNSSSAKLTVSGVKPVITVQPKAATVIAGTNVTFRVTAAGTGLSYQWQYSTNNGTTWKTWSGKTSASVSVKAGETNNGTCYRVTVKNTSGSVNSEAAKLTAVSFPSISENPERTIVNAGTAVTLSVKASGGSLKYQWQYSTDQGKTWKNWSGKTASSVSFKPQVSNNGTLYRCEVSNIAGKAVSSEAELTVFSGSGEVFWTLTGTKYHTSANCRALKNSTVIFSGTIKEAKDFGKEGPCSFCA